MQIFVNYNNKSRTINVEAEDTIQAVIKKIWEKLAAETPPIQLPMDRMRLYYNGNMLLDDNLTIEKLKITKETTLTLKVSMGPPFPAEYDQTVEPILANDLISLGQVQTPFVFISIGSYDHGRGNVSIKRQQCPDALLNWCRQKGLNLRVLLIDSAFYPLSPLPQQIYNIDTDWRLNEPEVAGGKVRRYSYQGQNFQLWIYATNVLAQEYNGTAKTLAGEDLIALGNLIKQKGGFLVVGKFYATGARPFLAVGDPGVLQQLDYSLESQPSQT